MSDGAVLVFARRPELGLVKTRLANCLGDRTALAVYRAFLTDTLLAARQTGATVLLAHTPGPHFPEQELADIAFEQRGRTFGERFDAALWDATGRLPSKMPLILIGADTPHLSPDSLRHALGALQGYDAVLGPSFNGGFYLLGFSTQPVPISEAFSHPSARETAETVRILLQAGVKPKLLDFWFDVDLPEDLLNLNLLIDVLEATGEEWIPPRTRTVLREDGMVATLIQEWASRWMKHPAPLLHDVRIVST